MAGLNNVLNVFLLRLAECVERYLNGGWNDDKKTVENIGRGNHGHIAAQCRRRAGGGGPGY
jgi:hypothetical protein